MCPNTSFSHTTCSLSRYNVKGEYIVLTARRGGGGGLSSYSLQRLQNKAITIHVFAKKSTRPWGIFNNYKGNLSVPRVQTAVLTEQQNHNASIQLKIGEQ